MGEGAGKEVVKSGHEVPSAPIAHVFSEICATT